MPATGKIITQKTIADRLNLHPTTVSMALRNMKLISPETRKRVLQMAEELNYRPNIMARGLRGGQTRTVGILFSLGGVHNPTGLVEIIVGRIHEHHYVTQVSGSFFRTEVVQRVLRDYIQRGVESAVIQMSSDMRVEDIEDMFPAFKAVVLVPSLPQNTQADQIVVSRQRAIYDAVDHLLDAGRKRPMILVPPTPREEKIEPFLHRLQQRGVTYQDEPAIFHRSHALMNMADVAWEALESHCPDSIPFDALLCGTDETAIAAYKWLQSRGVKIPHDVAVVGFNDSTYAKFLTPALASISRRDEEVAQLVEKTLFDRLENPDMPPRRVDVDMTFVPRASAGGCQESVI